MNAIVIYEVKQAELSDVQGLGLERERERTRIMLGFLASITEYTEPPEKPLSLEYLCKKFCLIHVTQVLYHHI